jgi:hypothetical protein
VCSKIFKNLGMNSCASIFGNTKREIKWQDGKTSRGKRKFGNEKTFESEPGKIRVRKNSTDSGEVKITITWRFAIVTIIAN